MFVPNSHEIESSQLCRRFTFSEIQLATENLDESLVIGSGGFGKVYKGTISNGSNISTVAIKRLDSTSNQGASEFWAEVNMLSNLRHCHLVSLIGYCNDAEEMILVYEYMSRGTLEDHLHRCQIPLSWVKRLAICIGAARGLDYLHTGTGIKHGVVHRDLKSSNILLHDTWAAKISDFGLSKYVQETRSPRMSTPVSKARLGILIPITFTLIVVLIGEEQCGLAIWAQDSIKEGRLKEIVDINIRWGISPKCLKVFAQLAKRCLRKNPKQRPTMAEVVVGLESIMALQEKANNTSQFFGMKVFAIGGQNPTLHRFDFDTISVATGNFCEANRIPQLKTYDSSHKGKLQRGQHIAVSEPYFGNINIEYMNEVSIPVKLEHENVAKLLGYCIEETRLFLVYDFALHATLGSLIYDPACTILKWDKRYTIILGVARALHYLHKDAPIRIVHGDVKPENILLDENLNPALSGFQYARAVNDSNYIHVDEICGTIGYMAPEHLRNGDLSTKVDVYSFGALVLETMTGQTMSDYNTSLDYKSLDCKSLLEYVQRNWIEESLSNIIDLRIVDVDLSSMKRFMEIGLLCVQEDAEDRPTMEEVVPMLLGNSSLTLSLSKMRARIIGQQWMRFYD